MSGKSKEITKVFACIVDSRARQLIELFESCRESVWLSTKCCCTRGGLRGVPTKRVDLCIDDRILSGETIDCRDVIEFTVVRKSGRYDGSQRDRLTLRVQHGHVVRDTHEQCSVNIVELPDSYRVDVVTDLGVVRWTREYPRLRSDLAEYDPERLVMWHWTRYYQHLEHAVAEQTAKQWVLTDWAQFASGWTLAEANRSASRALYRASRDEGWRKLTLRERTKLGITGNAQWHRVDSLPIHEPHHSGAGQATIEAANGQDVDFNSRLDDEALYELQEHLESA